MANYSYSKEFIQNNVLLGEFDQEKIKRIFTKIFDSYNPKIKAEVFDSFCEDF